MKNKTTLPTAEIIKSFTREMIDALPNWDDHDKTGLGGFAKKQWMKAPASLVFIVIKDKHDIGYVTLNSYNGAISKNFFTGSIFLRDVFGGKMWVAGPMNMYSDIQHYVTNPEVTV